MSDLEEFGGVPDIERREWHLGITGAVDRPLRATVEELRGFGLETFTADFECVEGWSAPDVSWRGVRMKRVLDRTDPVASSRYALVRAMDGPYACSFSLDRLSAAILAVDLDGEPLPLVHGGPARLVPTGAGSDCWEHVKWVDSIEVREREPVEEHTATDVALSRIE